MDQIKINNLDEFIDKIDELKIQTLKVKELLNELNNFSFQIEKPSRSQALND